MSLIQMLCKKGPLKRKIWEHKISEYRFFKIFNAAKIP